MAATTPLNDEESEIVISATTKISANSPPKTTINHLMSGASGQRVEWLQGTPEDIKDIFALNKARGKPWGPKMFMFAPGPNVDGRPAMTREFLMTVAWPACAVLFGIPPDEGIICEHIPQRPQDSEHTHYHICVNHYDPLTGKARSWSWDRAKLERFSRTMEVLTNTRVLTGRFQSLVIRELRKMGENEMADAIEKATPPDSMPADRTAARGIEQAAKSKGIDLRDLQCSVRAAYVAASGLKSFRAALAELGLTAELSYRIPHRPAWVIVKDGEVVRSLGKCLPRVPVASILEKLSKKEPENAEQLDLIDAIAAAAPTEPGGDAEIVRGSSTSNDHVHREGTRLEGALGDASHGAVAPDREEIARLFSRVLTSVEPEKVRTMQQEVEQIMVSPLLRAVAYFRKVIADAKAWLEKIYPRVSPFLERSRKVVAEAAKAKSMIEAQEKAQEKKLKRMELGLDIVEIGKAAHESRVADEKKALRDIQDKLETAKAGLDELENVRAQFEHSHADKVAEVEEENTLKIGVANRRIRSAVRCQALVKAHPEVAVMGAMPIFYRALSEERAAEHKTNARFKIEQPESYSPDQEDLEPKPPGPK